METGPCGGSSTEEHRPSKTGMRVRFPSNAPGAAPTRPPRKRTTEYAPGMVLEGPAHMRRADRWRCNSARPHKRRVKAWPVASLGPNWWPVRWPMPRYACTADQGGRQRRAASMASNLYAGVAQTVERWALQPIWRPGHRQAANGGSIPPTCTTAAGKAAAANPPSSPTGRLPRAGKLMPV